MGMRSFLIAVLLVLLTGCQAPGMAPTVTPAVPTTVPSSSPTSTASAQATPIPPTGTPEPTTTQTREPLPEISLESLVGTWTQFDDLAGGNNWWIYREDGTYTAKHGPTVESGVLVAEGTFTLDGDVVSIFEPVECPAGERYQIRFVTSDRIRYDLVDSTCDWFADDFLRLPIWRRFPAE